MKTFEQFRAWMKDQQAWEKFITNFSRNMSSRIEDFYSEYTYTVIDFAFTWEYTSEGYAYWKEISCKFRKFYSTLYDEYDFVVVEKLLARVNMPKGYTTCQLGFVQSSLEKKYPDCVIKADEKGVSAFKRVWKLKKI